MLGKKVFPLYRPPPQYTGELFGVEYLLSQTGASFCPKEEDLDVEIDEGFADFDELVDEWVNQQPKPDDITVTPSHPPTDSENDDDEDEVLYSYSI